MVALGGGIKMEAGPVRDVCHFETLATLRQETGSEGHDAEKNLKGANQTC